jgi:hypothetical protein
MQEIHAEVEGKTAEKPSNDRFFSIYNSFKNVIYRVIHERGISEFLFAATHYTHCNNILISNFENNYN